jgi:hypothetical protein
MYRAQSPSPIVRGTAWTSVDPVRKSSKKLPGLVLIAMVQLSAHEGVAAGS